MSSERDMYDNVIGAPDPQERPEYREPGQEPKKKKKKKKGKFIALLVLEILLVLVIAAGAFIFFWSKSKVNNMQRPAEEAGMTFDAKDVVTNPDIPEEVVEKQQKGYTTFMIYGVDARNNRDMVRDANADTDIINSAGQPVSRPTDIALSIDFLAKFFFRRFVQALTKNAASKPLIILHGVRKLGSNIFQFHA